ncbi:PAS domain S-box protein [Mucilaginibacter pallidiroseus]|uniref:histidine kinase n=1 Tax=Mucilaginibacter pallidiroseus TaxID=2599295 RepID=A0A563UE13_9SPHI|nr:PAS domain-containing sensor histidine kinase [Mucilaginibacter pallidiroseus]TWR29592.1 PAS domain S-box protein [Mucilaginibacter pallidiroseus]
MSAVLQEYFDKDLFSLERFFEVTADLMCIAGYDGYFRRINPAVSKLLGYSEEELFARPISDFIYCEDKMLTAVNRQLLVNDVPLINYENRYVKKNGEIVWLSWTSMPVKEEKVVYAIAKDVTHKKKQDHDRNLLIKELTVINRELKQLTYGASHDMRSPVNNLLMIFGMLNVNKIEDKNTVEFINVLRQATEDLKDTLNNYLDDMASARTSHNNPMQVSFAESLETVKRSLSALIINSGTQINANFKCAPGVAFNKVYMDSIFLNMISNSIKYARPGHPPVINISSVCQDGVCQLTFSDNGIGFDMDKVHDKLFGLQQTFHDHDDSKGIGLYLVHSYVTNLGGQISAHSEVNKGTTFTITFKKD